MASSPGAGFIPQSASSRVSSWRERSGLAWVLAVLLGCTVIGLLWLERADLVARLDSSWGEIALWILLILLANLLSFEADPIQFTLDAPLILASAILYEPAVAAAIALVGSLDVRELFRRVSLSRAIYNRAQIAISAFLSGVVYHQLASSFEPWPRALLATAASTAAFWALNVVFVVAGMRVVKPGVRSVFGRLRVGVPLEFFFTYFTYGVIAQVLARLFRDVGPWSVVLFQIPIVVGFLALVRAERLADLALRLRKVERLLQRLSSRIVDERKDERRRIAADLHDEVLQSLIRLSQLGHFLRNDVNSKSRSYDDALEVVQVSDEAIESLRRVVSDLRESPLGRGGLVPTLQGLARDLQLEWGTRIHVVSEGQGSPSPESQMVAYQVAREALINALKHASADEIRVRLRIEPPSLDLQVEDDGSGFDPRQVDPGAHFGLPLIEERVRVAGGTLRIEASPGKGTKLSSVLPL